MTISVIVPVYNVEPYLADCLRSVGAQVCECEVECLVVDDRGSDRSVLVAEEFIGNYTGPVNFRIVRRERNGGLSAARNSGMEAASGDYVYFLDSDDELLPGALAALVDSVVANPGVDMVISRYECLTTSPEVRPLPMIPGTQLVLRGGELLRGREIMDSFVRGDWFVMAVAKFYRFEFLRQCGLTFANGLLHEDELWSFQVAARANSMAVTDSVTYLYKIRPNSITTSKPDYRRLTFNQLEILEQIRNEVYAAGMQHDYMQQLNLQRWLTIVLAKALKLRDMKFYCDAYCEARRRAPIRFKDLFIAFKRHPKQLLRSAHWLLPPMVAAKLMYGRSKTL